MTTPTKEQIDELYAKLRKGLRFKWEWMVSETPGSESNRKELFSKIITEWEKIKDVDARVEKMCKNNPGIKDFEDFNKAINSPK